MRKILWFTVIIFGVILFVTCINKKNETELIIDKNGYYRHTKPLNYNNQQENNMWK